MPKLKVKNDWEYLTYEFKGREVPEKSGGTAILSDGTKVKYDSIETSVTYGDMGHSYETTQYRLIFETKVHGAKVKCDLSEFNLRSITPGKEG